MRSYTRRLLAVLRSTLSRANPEDDGVSSSFRRNGTVLVLAALAIVLVLSSTAGAALALLFLDGTPGENSAEAGFARDMMVHHAQAVEMAEISPRRTKNERIRVLATDIVLTQQNQIGQMQGWLAVWGLPATGTEPPMAWMDHPVEEGRMPDMASPEEISRLQKAPPEEADELFLRPMIPHHQAAVPMAEAVLEETDRQEGEQLAIAIVASQQGEIAMMQDLLHERGVAPAETEPPEEPGPDHDHGSHPDGAHLPPQELVVGLAHGAAQGAAAFLAGLAAFVALVWLPATRTVGAGRDATGFFVRPFWALFALLVLAGAVELSLYAVQASGERFSLGLLGQALSETRVGDIWLARVGLAALVVAAATWGAARPERVALWWAAVGIGGALLVTLTQLSHAAAEGRFLPFLADWLHLAAASLWTGGLLGFTLVLLGPLRAVPAQQQHKLRRRTVRRFSRIATLAVMALIVTGAYAILLHVPSV